MAKKRIIWKKPVPLDQGIKDRKIPEYPVEALGEVMGPAARDIARVVQAPPGIVAQSLLSAATLAAQGRADVEVDSFVTPISNYFLTMAPSSERKSTVNKIALQEIRRHEALLASQQDDERQERKQASVQANERAALKREQVSYPMVILEDTTYDGILSALHEGYPASGVFSDEGGAFLGGASMSRDARQRTAAGFSKLWDGELIALRRKYGAHRGHECRLSMHLMMQPAVGKEVFEQRFYWEQGFLARCQMLEAHGMAGTREYSSEDVHEKPSVKRYQRSVRELIKPPLKFKAGTTNVLDPRRLKLTPQALSAWTDAFNALERSMAPGKRNHKIVENASRAPNHILRIAAVMSLLKDPSVERIKSNEINMAYRLVRHYLGHARRLSGCLDEELQTATKLLSWLGALGEQQVLLSRIYQGGPPAVRPAQSARAAVRLLEKRGWLKRIVNSGPEMYRLHPDLVREGHTVHG